MTEIAIPATALGNHAIAKWVRDRGVAVDVHSSEELGVPLAAGVHPARMTVHSDSLGAAELTRITNLGVGRVIINSFEQIEALAAGDPARPQNVLLRMTDVNAPVLSATGAPDVQCGFRFDSDEADYATMAVLGHKRLNLVGLHCDVGSHEQDFISYPAAIGHMIAQMTHIRREYGLVLTRLGLGGGRTVPTGDWGVELPELATQIDESLDDGCATLRFPRPVVVISIGAAVEQSAA